MLKLTMALAVAACLTGCQGVVYFAAESPSGELIEEAVLPLASAADADPVGTVALAVSPGAPQAEGDLILVRVAMESYGPDYPELSLAALNVRDDAGNLLPLQDGEDVAGAPLVAVGAEAQQVREFRFALPPGGLEELDSVLLELQWWLPDQDVRDEIRFDKIVETSDYSGLWSIAFSVVSFGSSWGGGGSWSSNNYGHGNGHGNSHGNHQRRSPDPRRGGGHASPARSRGGPSSHKSRSRR